MTEQPKIFISHTTRDKRDSSLAHSLAAGLQERGSQVWIAPDNIPTGAEWEHEIISAVIDKCTHFLVILSAASIKSRWVLNEISLAQERRDKDASFTILPLHVGKTGRYAGSDFIQKFQAVPYKDTLSDQLDAIAVGLNLRPGVPNRYDELTEGFVGREYVFTAIEEFLAGHTNGCFTVVGDPGEGKSAILAEYVRRTGCVAHFNLRSEGINKAKHCLKSISAQLSARYGLSIAPPPMNQSEYGQYWNDLLKQAAVRVKERDRLVIVLDALDEVDTSDQLPGANVLFLPRYLPEGVFLLMTRRRMSVPFVNQSPQKVLDLIDYRDDGLRDVETFITHATKSKKVQKWIKGQKLSVKQFVVKLASKSECNFMYLHYVLPEIEDGAYRDLELEKLPTGLEGYYEDHWVRMGMMADPVPRNKIRIVYVMAEARRPVSRQLISEFAKEDAMTVQRVIDEWHQFLHKLTVEKQARYSIYHASFLDFLHRKDIVQAAGETIEGVNQAIVDSLWQGLIGDE
jgi:hypothetical protein